MACRIAAAVEQEKGPGFASRAVHAVLDNPPARLILPPNSRKGATEKGKVRPDEPRTIRSRSFQYRGMTARINSQRPVSADGAAVWDPSWLLVTYMPITGSSSARRMTPLWTKEAISRNDRDTTMRSWSSNASARLSIAPAKSVRTFGFLRLSSEDMASRTRSATSALMPT